MSDRTPAISAATFTRFGDYLKYLRRRAQLSQRQVAIAVGYSEMQISRLERDQQRPDPHTLMALFVPALDLEDEPELVARLLELAALGRAAPVSDIHSASGEARPVPDARPPEPAVPPVSPDFGPILTGTVTLLCSEMVGQPSQMPDALAHLDTLLREAIAAEGGVVIKTTGTGLYAAFSTASTALAAALAAQRRLAAQDSGASGRLQVCMALHTGAVEGREGDAYAGILNRLTRLSEAGHGGQVLLSRVTQDLVHDDLPSGTTLRDLGTYQLRDLERQEQVFQLVAPDLPAEFPPLRGVERRRQQLPAPPTTFIGREREIAAVVDLLRGETRLLTLTGPGGTGKTRLSLKVAAELLDDFADGIWFVDLAPIRDPALVVSTIATTLDVREAAPNGYPQPLIESLQAFLSEKQLLLILDNFEQVLAAALLLADLLQAAPRLKLLVTSRSVLGVYGEQAFAMPPLALPDRSNLPPLEQLTQYEAVRLFIQRAQASKADFVVTDASAPAVAEICHRLDGLPLAIELAAARIRLLPPEALLRRLVSRLQLLTGGARTLPARQQTLRNAIAWSYDLLDPAEQTLFRRLAVFVGGWTMETAEAVCSGTTERPGEFGIDLLDGLQSLLDKSLLRLSPAWDGEPRFTMLETIREYAIEQLTVNGEVEAITGQHAAFFLDLAEQSLPALTGPDQRVWLLRFDLEHDNLRAALAWTLDHNREQALRLATSLEWFWYLHGDWSEGRAWIARALAQTDVSDRTVVRSRAQLAAAELAYFLNDYAEATTLYEEGLAVSREFEDDVHAVAALQGLANVALHQRDYERARVLLEESLPLVRAQGDNWRIGNSLHKLGDALLMQGNLDQAATLFDEGLVFYRKAGDKGAIAASLTYAGGIARQRGDLRRARALCEEGLQLCRELNHKLGMAWALRYLGTIAQDEGDHARAAASFAESLRLRWELRDREGIAWTLEGLAEVACARDERGRAARLWGQAEVIREAVGAALSPGDRERYDQHVAACAEGGDAEQFAVAWEEGRRMPIEDAVVYALAGS